MLVSYELQWCHTWVGSVLVGGPIRLIRNWLRLYVSPPLPSLIWACFVITSQKRHCNYCEDVTTETWHFKVPLGLRVKCCEFVPIFTPNNPDVLRERNVVAGEQNNETKVICNHSWWTLKLENWENTVVYFLWVCSFLMHTSDT